MGSKKRGGLGQGIRALIPHAAGNEARPVDIFFGGTHPAEAKPTSAFGNITAAAEQAAAQKSPITDILTTAKQSAELSDKESAANAAADKSALQEVPGAVLVELELKDIQPNRVNPRKEFDPEALAELSHSIKEFGVFQPIVVREIKPAPTDKNLPSYELIMGERRFRATKLAGLNTIPAIVRGVADEDMLRDALLENLHRADLNPLEEASAYQQLMDDFGITQEQLAAKIGRSRPQISNTIRLLKLPEQVQMLLVAGKISAGHARALLGLNTSEQILELAEKIITKSLTVRETEAEVNRLIQPKPSRPRAGGKRNQLDEISKNLSSRFDTRVAIKLGAKKGQIVIDFATYADLDRILQSIGTEGIKTN